MTKLLNAAYLWGKIQHRLHRNMSPEELAFRQCFAVAPKVQTFPSHIKVHLEYRVREVVKAFDLYDQRQAGYANVIRANNPAPPSDPTAPKRVPVGIWINHRLCESEINQLFVEVKRLYATLCQECKIASGFYPGEIDPDPLAPSMFAATPQLKQKLQVAATAIGQICSAERHLAATPA